MPSAHVRRRQRRQPTALNGCGKRCNVGTSRIKEPVTHSLRAAVCAIACMVLLLRTGADVRAAVDVLTVRTPEEGIQPQAAIDSKGDIHLIYYRGEPGAGDIFYVKRAAKEKAFSTPIPVNTQKGSAIAAGSIRGAQLAVGKAGRVHVVWDGMGKGTRKVQIGGKDVAPLLYTRLNDTGTAFEPERNIITYAAGLDGGSSVAADARGHVYVTWHGHAGESGAKEAGRAVFVAMSKDDGRTFAREQQAVRKATGACACCGMRALADSRGAVYVLFRAATENIERGVNLLVATQPGADFQVAFTHPWQATQCPMSSMSLCEAPGGVFGAWETGDNVFLARFDSAGQASRSVAPAAGPKRKHPVVATNTKGETLLVWTEGTSWGRGGTVYWQAFDAEQNPVGQKGHAAGLPAWSLPTAVAQPDGSFVVIY
jgi:hypothetical protein